jgi:hypothetical protein
VNEKASGRKKGNLTLKDSVKHNETKIGYDQPTAGYWWCLEIN